MKRFVLPFLLVASLPAVAPTALSAQWGRIDRARRILTRQDYAEIGVVGGPNRTTVTGAGPVDGRIRGSLGGFLSVPVVGSLRIRPELAVSGKQVAVNREIIPPCLPPGGCLPVADRQTASFTWLEVPVLAEVRFPRALGNWGSPRLYAGPFVAVRLGCSLATPLDGGVAPETRYVQSCSSPEVGSQYNNGDAGFVVGGAIATGGVGIGVRWIRSLVPVAPFQVSGGGFLTGAKTSTLALTLELGSRLY